MLNKNSFLVLFFSTIGMITSIGIAIGGNIQEVYAPGPPCPPACNTPPPPPTQASTELQITGGTFNYQTGTSPTASVSGTIQPEGTTDANSFQSQCAGANDCNVVAQLGLETTSLATSGFNIVNPHTGLIVGPEGGPLGLQTTTTTTGTSVYTGEENNLDPACSGQQGGLTCDNINFDFNLDYNAELSSVSGSTTTGNTHFVNNDHTPFVDYTSDPVVTEATINTELTSLLLEQKAETESQSYTANIDGTQVYPIPPP